MVQATAATDACAPASNSHRHVRGWVREGEGGARPVARLNVWALTVAGKHPDNATYDALYAPEGALSTEPACTSRWSLCVLLCTCVRNGWMLV